MTFCQVIIEDLQYSDVLDKAAQCENSLEQLAYVAAFNASTYAKTCSRVGKPFNPMLGETYEFDDTGVRGWRALAEQVNNSIFIIVCDCMYVVCSGWSSSSPYSNVCRTQRLEFLAGLRDGQQVSWAIPTDPSTRRFSCLLS